MESSLPKRTLMGQQLALISNRYDLNKNNKEWTDAERETIIDMFNAKNSIGIIANHFGVTRNSIVGTINRLRKNKTVLNGKMVLAANERYIRRGHKTLAGDKPPYSNPHVLLKQQQEKPQRVRLRIVPPEKVTFKQLQYWMCRYPEGDPRQSDFRFCGQKKEHGKSYCPHHYQLCTKESYYKYKPPAKVPLPR